MVLFDLKNWGYKYKNNGKRLFFEGHEREDVKQDRSDFIDHFLENKEHYYRIDEKTNEWIMPTLEPWRLVSYHDESNYCCNEQSPKKWFKDGCEPFVSKGRGRSLMVSDFLVSHPSGPFFTLNEKEWKAATKRYPSLLEDQGINYEPRTCIGSIIPGQEGYFDSDSILNQFERLFQMLQFKEAFKGHEFEIVVDNARTHTAQTMNINEYRLNIGKNCPKEFIIWKDENNNEHRLDLFFKKGVNAGLSKGLRVVAKELGFNPVGKKLDELKAILIKHPAFSSTTKLEALGQKYGVKIIFCPKFHCELNPIEGRWCLEKGYVRKHSDQTFFKMLHLIKEARNYFEENQFYKKLINRFWNCLFAYKAGATYGEVLKTYFGNKNKKKL